MDPLCTPGTCGAALADESVALVAAETQRAAQLSAHQAVHRAVYGVVWRAAIGRCKNRERNTRVRSRKTPNCDKATHQFLPLFGKRRIENMPKCLLSNWFPPTGS